MFMYLHLKADDDGKLHATLQNDGTFRLTSIGTPSSQMSHGPILVMRIEDFEGLEALDDKSLLEELLRRFTTKELLTRLGIRLTTDELVRLVADRLKGRN